MVGSLLRAKAAALSGESAPSTPVVGDASIQTEQLKGEAAVQTSDCRKRLDLSPGAGTDSRPACKRCSRVLSCRRQRRLRNVREVEKEIDSWFQV